MGMDYEVDSMRDCARSVHRNRWALASLKHAGDVLFSQDRRRYEGHVSSRGLGQTFELVDIGFGE
jgi:hypothetical protein